MYIYDLSGPVDNTVGVVEEVPRYIPSRTKLSCFWSGCSGKCPRSQRYSDTNNTVNKNVIFHASFLFPKKRLSLMFSLIMFSLLFPGAGHVCASHTAWTLAGTQTTIVPTATHISAHIKTNFLIIYYLLMSSVVTSAASVTNSDLKM